MLTVWRPFRELAHWPRELDNFFARRTNGETERFAPAVDIEETGEGVTVRADLPGVKQADIEVTVHEGFLLLSGKRENKKVEEGENRFYSERSSGAFLRKFRLGPDVDPEHIEASFTDGVLTVELKKKEEIKPRQIPVKTN